MTGALVTMSYQELNRLTVLEKVATKQLSQIQAAKQLGLSERQLRRWQRRYAQEGASGLASRQRGKPSNHRLPESIKRQAIELIEAHYRDFGPTLAHEKLIELHALHLSRESVRQLMIQAGLWDQKSRRSVAIHQRRMRRPCRGELVQLDGSPHAWFEERAEKCCLLVWVDDATSELLHLRFEPVETTQGYFRGMKDYLKHHGRPACLYVDRHGIFRQNQGSDLKELEDPQFTRAMKELGIEVICANSPQAKGRVERMNGVLQNRLVKELRLQKISSLEQANAFLPSFIEDYNRRFAVEPQKPHDSHQALALSNWIWC